MSLHPLFMISLVGFLALSCSPEDPLINSFDDRWRLILSNQRGELVSVPVPAEAQPTVIWSDPTDSARHSLHRFRDCLYLVHSSRPWIVVFDADTVRAIDTIITGTFPATSIAFANATTAYATIPDAREVAVIDLTVNELARSIPMPSRPMQIAANGNQLCVTLPDTNAVTVIDSRTLQVERVIPSADTPWYVASDPSSAMFCIVGLGAGKIDGLPASAATLQFLDATTRVLSAPLEITPRSGSATQVFPTGLTVTTSQTAIITTQLGMFRASTRTRSRVSSALSEKFSAITFNDARAEVIGQVSTPQGAILIYNNGLDALLHRITVSSPATSMVGIVR